MKIAQAMFLTVAAVSFAGQAFANQISTNDDRSTDSSITWRSRDVAPLLPTERSVGRDHHLRQAL